jgi:uncharacterized delta-60 repeat protein
MKRTLCLNIVLALSFSALLTHAQLRSAGYIDTSFAAPCLSNTFNFTNRALALQADGRILFGGNYSVPLVCQGMNGIGRLRTNGAADTTFISPFTVNNLVNAIAFQSDGRIVVGGWLSDGASIFAVARLGVNGALDGTFVRELAGGNIFANALAVLPDDRIIMVGYERTGPGNIGVMTRLSRNGIIDSTFQGTTPVSPNGQGISAVALQSGKIILGGSFTSYSDGVQTLSRDGIVRLQSSGIIDVPFLPPISNADIRAILVQPDGKILVAGRFTFSRTSGLVNRCLVRLNENGSEDTSFEGGVDGQGTIGLALALQPDGKILLGHTFGIVRLNTNSVIDSTFGPLNAVGLLGTEADVATSLALLPDKRVLVGATRVGVDATQRRTITRLWGDIPPPPVITQQPVTQTVDAGTNVTFSVIATGAPPIFFQWRKDGVKIPNATNTTLALNNVNSTDTANYTVVATNFGGAVTSQVARLIVEFDTSALTLITNGQGAVLPNLTKEPLEIGRSYTITARPVVGNLFSNWTGDVTSSSPVLTFVMQTNMTIVVNFVPSPFIPVKGIYNGLFFNTGAPAHESAGALALTLDDKGGIRGSVKMGTRTRKFKGTFSVERTATVTLPATATAPALFLEMEIDVVNAIITGSISFGTNASTNSSALVAYRNPFSSRSFPAPMSGNYNAVLPGVDDPTLAPAGDGSATLTLSTAGRISGGGALADGTMFRVLSASSVNAQVPVYVPLYAGRGSLFGWLTVTNGDVTDVSGTLWWIKPGTVGGLFYPAGFSNEVATLGSRYIAPARGTPVLTLNNGVVILTSGNLAEPLTNSITLGGDNRIVGDNQLTLTISPVKGTVSGSFVDPLLARKRIVKGIALPKQDQARGFFLGNDQGGRLLIGEAP